MFQSPFSVGVDEHGLHLIVARTESSVKRHTVEPMTEVGLGNGTPDDAFEIGVEVGSNGVEMVSIDQHHDRSPFG